MAAIGRLRLRETAWTAEAWLVCSPLGRRVHSVRSRLRPRAGAEEVVGALVRADEAGPELSLHHGARVQRDRARLPITPCRLAVDAARGGVAGRVQRQSGHGGREELNRVEEERAAHAVHRIILKHARANRHEAAAEHLAGGVAARREKARRRDRGRGLARVLRHRLGHVEKAGGAVAHHRPMDIRVHHMEERREGAKERLDERDHRECVADTEVEVDGAVGAKVKAEGRSKEASRHLEREDELDR